MTYRYCLFDFLPSVRLSILIFQYNNCYLPASYLSDVFAQLKQMRI